MLRDEDTNTKLSEAGWLVLRFWEHEDSNQVAKEIETIVKKRRRG